MAIVLCSYMLSRKSMSPTLCAAFKASIFLQTGMCSCNMKHSALHVACRPVIFPQAGSAKDKAYNTGADAVNSASATSKQAYDATKGAAEDLAATLKSYLTWAQSKASELTKTSKDTTNVGSGVRLAPLSQTIRVTLLQASVLVQRAAVVDVSKKVQGACMICADVPFTCYLAAAQSFTKIASEKVDQAKDAASKTKDKTTGTSKDVYNSVADKLQSARDASAKQLEDTRAAADEQWAKLQKVQHSSSSSLVLHLFAFSASL